MMDAGKVNWKSVRGAALVLGAVAASWGGLAAWADIGNSAGWGTIPYEGMLEKDGVPVGAASDFRFSLFSDETTGTPGACPSSTCLWQEEQLGVPVAAGRFSVRLGQVTALTDAVAGAPDLFLAVDVRISGGSYVALSGRQRLGAAAFALSAKRAVPQQDFVVDRNTIVGGSVGIGTGTTVPAAPLHVVGTARADQWVTSPVAGNQLSLQGAGVDSQGSPILLGAGGAGGVPSSVAIPRYADIGPAWAAPPAGANPQAWRYGDCQLKINMLQRPGATGIQQTYSAYGDIGTARFAPGQADLAELFQWGWVCWNRSDTNEDDDLLHPYLGSLRAAAGGAYQFPTQAGMQSYAYRERISLNQDYGNWAANNKVCGRVGWIAAVDGSGTLATGGNEFRILAWYSNTQYYGFYDMTETNPNHALWHDSNGEHAGASGSFDRWSLWVCR